MIEHLKDVTYRQEIFKIPTTCLRIDHTVKIVANVDLKEFMAV